MGISIRKKYIIQGELENKSPMLIGGGKVDISKDVAFIKDHKDRPFLPGTTLAGSMESHLRNRYESKPIMKYLWGTSPQDKDSFQAHFIIDDALIAESKDYKLTIRDGVKIDNSSGRAMENALYDYEVLDPGAHYNFSAEIVVREGKENEVGDFLKTFEEEFGNKEFQVGALSSFGFGRMEFKRLEIAEISEVNDWLNYLSGKGVGDFHWQGGAYTSFKAIKPQFLDIEVALKQSSAFIARNYSQELTDELTENIDGVEKDSEESAPDSISMISGGRPVLTGKTLKGALRAQAVSIVNTMQRKNKENYSPAKNPCVLLDDLFGKWIEKNGDAEDKTKSLLEIYETPISCLKNLQVHQRVKIDRFTGGAVEGALFNSVPVYPDRENDEVNLEMRLNFPKKQKEDGLPKITKAYLGLLVFLLRDLHDKLFCVGGEKAIGRGLFDVENISIKRGEESIVSLEFANLNAKAEKLNSWIIAFQNEIKNEANG